MTGTAAIIAAGGRGVRMDSPVPKQFLSLLGRPLIWHTLRVFEDCSEIDDIVLVLPAEHVAEIITESKNWGFKKVKAIVAGGKDRHLSVRNGLEALSPNTQIIVVHDAVRPLVSSNLISDTIRYAKIEGACIAALPVTDTLKKISDQGLVTGTVSREGLWAAQTPQTFKAGVLRKAFASWDEGPFPATDEASILEYMRIPVFVVKGDSLNIKVTTPSDLKIAEILLKERYGAIQQ